MADIERLCKVYIKIRDVRSQLKKDFDTRDKELVAQQETISSAILDICKSLNTTLA